MKRALKQIITRIPLMAFLSSVPITQAAESPSIMDGNNAFALDLYSQLKDTPGNVFYSPYSISTALALTYAGAHGNTEKQMATVLHWPHDGKAVSSAFGQFQRQLMEAGKKSGVQLNIANALWTQTGHPFLPTFLTTSKNDFQANINQVDFKTEAENARKRINTWVEQQTKDKIKDLLPSGSVDASTRLVLANAVYFKGTWAKQFKASETSPQPFHLTATENTDVQLMHQSTKVRYQENDEFQSVDLPYKGGELSMLILLPRQIEDCKGLESKLTPDLLSKALGQMKVREVEIFLPRFKLESEYNLVSTLAKMGMPDAFDGAADFSGLDGAKDLLISGVFHKAWGEVNEEGTEAAAATGVTVALSSARQPAAPPPVFRADHPFIFFIRETKTGSLLFAGRLARPS